MNISLQGDLVSGLSIQEILESALVIQEHFPIFPEFNKRVSRVYLYILLNIGKRFIH